MPQRDTRPIGGIYRIGQTMTSGGMLSTYTAYNRNTNEVVGLSVVEVPPILHPDIVQQLLQPVEKRRSTRSSHVIHVHNWGLDGSRIFIATDPPRGVTLQHVVDNENIDLQRAVDLTRQVAIGLKTLHEQGIFGLDLRPQLITVDTVGVTDRVQIDDIGLRALLQSLGYISSQRTDDIGYLDPRYAPPEYINNGTIGAWSDLYQTGLLLFTLITGRLPFVGRTPAETGIMQSTGTIPSMSQFKHGTPGTLQQLIEQLLAKDTTQRIPSAGALIAALENIASSIRPVPTRPAMPILDKETKPPAVRPGYTAEMQPIEDMTLSATLINGKVPTSANLPVPEVPTSTGVYAYLSHEKDGAETQHIPITQRSTIVGRLDPKRGVTPDIDLSLLDPTMTISRQHARIRFEETFFYIEDLKSRNKTRLGQLVLTPLKAELLQHGDIIYFGSVKMIFEIPGMTTPLRIKDRKKES